MEVEQFFKDFQDYLAPLGKPSELRPFVCDGSPLECQAFIVGFNPATTMAADFWQFWRSGYGFDKAAWFNAYKRDRERRPLKAGKTRRIPISHTRQVIEWVLEAASPIRCLETNTYSISTNQAADLMSEQRVTAPFDFLLANIKPRIIVAHGRGAVKHIEGMCLSARIIPVSHFSRGWSRACAFELGLKIRAGCSDAHV